MKKTTFMTTAALIFPAATALAQMGNGQEGHMTGNQHGWGMGYGWAWGPILLIVVVLGAVYLLKKK
ncbi:MAG: hypothetical protein U0974_10925 [Gemmatimonadales bacterium]|nr:hypothetical protein [Gemmatimonadales bacterium]MDZ4390225.1 hypothetical protein [Gemmatimonadales bacterium]